MNLMEDLAKYKDQPKDVNEVINVLNRQIADFEK